MRGIRWRIASIYVVLIIATLFALSIYILNLADQHTINTLRASVTSQAYLVSQVAADSITAGNSNDQIDRLVKNLGTETNSRITIIAPDGTILGDSQADPATMENHASRPEIVTAQTDGIGYSIRTGTTTGDRSIYVAVPITVNAKTVGTARVAMAFSAVQAAENGINQGIIVAAALASVVAVMIAVLALRQVTNPIKQLTLRARELARGHFAESLDASRDDEVGELELAFNQMSHGLQRSLRSLSREKARLEAILATMADGIIITDHAGTIILTNGAAARMFGVTPHQMNGRSFVQVVRDHELANGMRACLETKELQTKVVELGPQHQVIRALFTLVNEVEGFASLVMLQDITEIRRTEATRRDFIANVSHELRTPLASLKALVETLQAGALDDREAAEHFLERMNNEVDDVTQIVKELLELSRIESGQAVLKPEEVELGPLLTNIANRLQAQADRAGLQLEVRVPDELPLAWADQDRLQQVISNLLHNAIKFTPNGGSITLSAFTHDDKMLAIEVRDSGVGIAKEDLPRIFERFYKVDKARSGGGTGLGLAIAKHIVQAHGGTIWAKSVEGQGATFVFTLPIATDVNETLTSAYTKLTSDPTVA
jgi:two-component system phosphate regulon sensor histidine kinase PhoR